MKILQINKFFYARGGAERVFLDTSSLLREKGHTVLVFSMDHPRNPPSPYARYFVSGVDLEAGDYSPVTKLRIAARILYSHEASRKLELLIKEQGVPHVAHLHNIYHQLSPSILYTLKKFNIPVVMTLHDYKMVCPSYALHNDGKPCERCSHKRYYWCLLKKCTKGSLAKSALNVLEMYLHHQIMKAYNLVDVFISPSLFLRDKMETMGFKGSVVHLPNFIDTREFHPLLGYTERAIYYAGRISHEKGLTILLEAAKDLDIEVKIIGDGPLREELESRAPENVHFLGYKPLDEMKQIARKCMGMVIPSTCYDNYPRSIIEAFALGKPVIGSLTGGIPELVTPDKTGFLFQPGNSQDLKEKIETLLSTPLQRIGDMGENARKFIEERFSPEEHYRRLMEIYQAAHGKVT